jgi:large subunit ribosomal protein L30
MMAKTKAEKTLKITLVRSTIGQKPDKRATVRSLGLRKINSTVEQKAVPTVLGMIRSVAHLVRVEELN